MGSGNFIIGAGTRLTLEGFDQRILPKLRELDYAVPNKDLVKAQIGGDINLSFLITLVGSGNLEDDLRAKLAELRSVLNEKSREKGVSAVPFSGYDLDFILALGLYEDNRTASMLFPTVAQSFHFKRVQREADELYSRMANIGKAFCSQRH